MSAIDWDRVSVKPVKPRRFGVVKGRCSILIVNLDLNPNMFYLMAALKGDGSVDKHGSHYRIRFSNNSEKLIEYVEIAMKQIGLNPCLGIYKQPTLTASSKMFYDFYNSFTYPDLGRHVETSDDGRDCALSFIRGTYESEGNYGEWGYSVRVSFCNTDDLIVGFCCDLLDYLGYSYSIYPTTLKSGKVSYNISILGGRSEVARFLDELNPCIKRGE